MIQKFFQLLFGSSEYVWVAYRLPRKMVDGVRAIVSIQNEFSDRNAEIINEHEMVETYIAEGLQRDLVDLHGPKIVNIRPRVVPVPRIPTLQEIEPDDEGRPIIAPPRRRQLRL